MPDPIATYGAKVLAKDGFRMSGDQRSGIKVTVRYLVAWKEVYNFINAMVRPFSQVTVGLITYTLPYSLPRAISNVPLYVFGFDIQPMGVDPELTPQTVLTYQGMAAGEYFSHGIVTLDFEQATFNWDASDDPDNLNQLDPDNPIEMCEQSIEYYDKMVTLKGHKYRYVSDGKAVVGDYGAPTTGADVVLRFPHVPYQPWRILNSYINTVNSTELFLCDAGTLLFKAPKTVIKPSMIGTTVNVEQSVTLTLKWNPDGWNKLPKADGTLDDVVKAGGGSIYDSVDFRPLFQQLSFTEASS